MLRVGVRSVGLKAPLAIQGKVRRNLMSRMTRALNRSVEEWRKLVVSSTWFSKAPAPTSSIIAEWSRGGRRGKDIEGWVLTYGWFAYRGSSPRALYRLGLREDIYGKKTFDRIRRAFAGRGAGNG